MSGSLKYRVERDDRLGRYLVANEFLKKGTRIFTDVPFALGPKPDSPVLCLGCHCLWNGCYRCRCCGWPCCSEQCERAPQHRDYECSVFSQAAATFQEVEDVTQPCVQLDCITPLRMLLSKEKDPERWEKEVTVMEDHDADRRLRYSWVLDDVNITQYLRQACQLDRFPEELIQKVCGILEVNAVEVPSNRGINLRAIYPRVGIMSHNCVPTVVHTIVTGGKNGIPHNFAEVWAAADIREGERLEMCYTQVLQATIQRRDFLKLSKFFDCECDRCADPTEFGTHMSTLKCNKCESGLVLPLKPLDKESDWNCDFCDFTTTSATVRKILEVIQREISRAEQSEPGPAEIEQREQAAQWYRTVLHQKHSLLTCLRYSLSQMYGRVEGYVLEELSIALLKRKANMCRQILEVLDVISPGQTRMRGITLYELHAPLMILARIEYKEGAITFKAYNEKMSEIAEMLHEAAEILSREDENSEKGVIGRAAMESYKNLLTTL